MTPRNTSLLAVCTVLCLSGCGRYADFTLPAVSGGDPRLSFVLDQRPDPVLNRGSFHDVLNPSVVKAPNGYLNLYSAFDGKVWHTALADSSDGLAWRDRGIVLLPDPKTWEGSYIAANGTALASGNRLTYWYQSGLREAPRIGLMEGLLERDGGVTWRKEPNPVLEPGPYGSWDECGVADPYAIRIGPYFYLYYLGQDRARPTRQRIGVARSRDGRHWEKLRNNPVLDLGAPGSFDEADLGEPAVWNSHGFFWMLYTGLDVAQNRRLGLARSTDGVHWEKLPSVFAGEQPWNSKVLCDPTVLVEGGAIRVWFGGGDVASRDENLHGQIGYGILRSVN